MRIGTWFGKNIEDLEKKELLDVIRTISKELQNMKKERESLGDDYYDLLITKKT